MNTNQKVATGVVVGILALVTGTYALYAGDRAPVEIASAGYVEPGSSSAQPGTSAASRAGGASPAAEIASTSPATATAILSGVTIPSGTTVDVKIHSQVSSRDAKVGDRVTGATLADLVINGATVIPAGSTVAGEVTAVKPASETRAAAVLKFTFTSIANRPAHLAMILPDLEARARAANHAVDAAIVVGGAAAGAVIGNQTGNQHGTEIGGVVGAVGGGVAAANIGANVQLKAGETAKLKFTQALSL